VLVEDAPAEALEGFPLDVPSRTEHRRDCQPEREQIHRERGRFEPPHHDDHPPHQPRRDDGGAPGTHQPSLARGEFRLLLFVPPLLVGVTDRIAHVAQDVLDRQFAHDSRVVPDEDLLVGETHVDVLDAVGACVGLLDAASTERTRHTADCEPFLCRSHPGVPLAVAGHNRYDEFHNGIGILKSQSSC
jgi:hypothetical protein